MCYIYALISAADCVAYSHPSNELHVSIYSQLCGRHENENLAFRLKPHIQHLPGCVSTCVMNVDASHRCTRLDIDTSAMQAITAVANTIVGDIGEARVNDCIFDQMGRGGGNAVTRNALARFDFELDCNTSVDLNDAD